MPKRTFYQAIEYGYIEDVRYYLRKRVDVNRKHRNGGESPVQQAARRGDVEIMKELLTVPGARVTTPALHFAALYGHQEMVRFLVEEAGAMVDMKNAIGETALSFAVWRDDRSTSRVLIKAGARTNDGALHVAARHCGVRMMRSLVNEGGALLCVKDKDGLTPLEHAEQRPMNVDWLRKHMILIDLTYKSRLPAELIRLLKGYL